MLTKEQIRELTEVRNLLVKVKSIIDKNCNLYAMNYLNNTNKVKPNFNDDIINILVYCDNEINLQNHENYKKENYLEIGE